MSNMHYCRFQNTLSDLRDCADAIRDGEELSPEEQRAKDKLVELCQQIVDEVGDNDGPDGTPDGDDLRYGGRR